MRKGGGYWANRGHVRRALGHQAPSRDAAASILDQSRLSLVTDRGIEGPPTLVIEILSPSTAQIDRSVKSQLYARYGVAYYWIVDPDTSTIDAYRPTGDAYELTGRLEGPRPIALEPFADLALMPARIWP
jgi:Uma2 family endonuclease